MKNVYNFSFLFTMRIGKLVGINAGDKAFAYGHPERERITFAEWRSAIELGSSF